jgi:hypothetical protein
MNFFLVFVLFIKEKKEAPTQLAQKNLDYTIKI